MTSLAALLAFPSPAAEWQVTNLNDDGAGSLRQLVATSDPGDQITFAVTGKITLTNGPLLLDKDLILTGPGPTSASLSGNRSDRVLLANSNVTAAISGLTICDGKAADGVAGGDNLPGGDGSSGGGVHNRGTLSLSNCWVIGNEAGNGGNGGRAATGGTGGHGGGIFNAGQLALIYCLVSNNASGLGGAGGVAATEQPGNAGGVGGSGGGVSSTGALLVHGCEFHANRAGTGGGGTPGYSPPTYPTSFGSGTAGGAGGTGGNGGAIFSAGMLQVAESRFASNFAGQGGAGGRGGHGWRFGNGGNGGSGGTGGRGGAMCVFSSTAISRSTLEGNSANRGGVGGNGGDAGYGSGSPGMGGFGGAGGNGGGLHGEGTVAVIACTVNSNAAGSSGPGGVGGNPYLSPSWPREGGSGGGVFGGATMTNCTITGNTSGRGFGGGHGGGGSGPLTLINCAIVGNFAGGPLPEFPSPTAYADGGGVAGNASLANTLIALNNDYQGMGDDHAWPDVAGTFTSLGGNLIGNVTGGSGFTSADLTGDASSPLNPLLASLADNGGPTWTHALLPGSPAIDRGRNAPAPTTDQRGLPRIICGKMDVGAFEVQGCLKPVFLEVSLSQLVACSLLCAGAANQTYTLQVSTNLSDWVDRTNLVAGPDGRFHFSELLGTEAVRRWYRLALP